MSSDCCKTKFVLDPALLNELGIGISSFTDNGDGTYTHDDGQGNTTVIGTVSALVDNGDGTYTHTGGDGTETVIDTASTPSTVTDNGDGTYTHDDGLGNTTVIGTVSALVDNGDGTYTHDDGLGNTTVIGHPCTPISCGTAPDGTTVIVTIVDGTAIYTTIGGTEWTGNPGDLT